MAGVLIEGNLDTDTHGGEDSPVMMQAETAKDAAQKPKNTWGHQKLEEAGRVVP